MAFTLITITLLLSVLAANAQINNLFSGGFPQAPNHLLGGGHGQRNVPTQPQASRELATCRMQNQAGNVLAVTLTEVPNPFAGAIRGGSRGLGGPFGFLGGPFNPVGQQLGFGVPSVRVVGRFVKTQEAETGLPNEQSLTGVFKIVVTSFGNTAAQCIGTGPPIAVSAQSQLSANPFSSFPGHFGHPFAPGGFASNYPGVFGGQGQIPLALDTDLRADTISSTIQGTLHGVRLRELLGSSLSICADATCSRKTDMCCSIVHDGTSVEEFEKALKLHLLLQQSNGNFPLGTDDPFDNPFGGADPPDPFGGI